MDRKTSGVIAVILWALVALLIVVVVPLATFVAPQVVNQAKAHGAQQLPFLWQLVVDLSDLCVHRWFLVFPILIAGAILASRSAGRKQP